MPVSIKKISKKFFWAQPSTVSFKKTNCLINKKTARKKCQNRLGFDNCLAKFREQFYNDNWMSQV